MRNYFALLFLLIFLAACGGGGGSGGNATGTTIPVGSVSGATFDGLISNANVNVYDFRAGAKGALLAHAVSDSKGQYSLSLQVESRPILLEITDGTYTEEAGVASVIAVNSTGSRRLSAVANYTTGSNVKIALTSFTHMAAGLAAYEISKGTAVATAVADANTRVSTLTGFDILATMPLQVTDPINANASLPAGLKYGFLEAAISMWTNNNAPAGLAHIAPYTSIDFTQQLYQDISADGLLDGMGLDATGKLVQLTFGTTTTKLGVDVYRLGLGVSMIQMAATSANKSGVTGPSLLTYAQAYVANTDAMFNNVKPLPIPSPAVAITSPATNTWGRKLVIVAASAVDATVGLGAIDILIDNVVVPASAVPVALPLPLTTSAIPSITVNTASIPDGTHTVGVRATNLGGLTTTSSIQLKIDNTPPTSTGTIFTTAISILGMIFPYQPTSSGVASDAATGSGIVGTSVLVSATGAAPWTSIGTLPAGGGWSYISPSNPLYFRFSDVAGNCTDYTATWVAVGGAYGSWALKTSGSCP